MFGNNLKNKLDNNLFSFLYLTCHTIELFSENFSGKQFLKNNSYF